MSKWQSPGILRYSTFAIRHWLRPCPSLFILRNRLAQVLKNSLDLLDILIAHAFAPAIAALQAVQNVLPHGPRRLQAARPFATPLQLPLEAPLPGETFRTKKTALAALKISI